MWVKNKVTTEYDNGTAMCDVVLSNVMLAPSNVSKKLKELPNLTAQYDNITI